MKIFNVRFGVEKPRRDPPVEVLPHLFLGSAFSASKAELESANISHVIRLGWGFFSDVKHGSVTFYDYPIEGNAFNITISRLNQRAYSSPL